ncbi:MAG: hypothetical protein LH609_05705 [Rudanella sp.]|nr:hypothetical protein [Rudanella sp.]
MTTAEHLINEGIEKGVEQGIAQANERHVKGLLKLGMDASTISAALELPLSVVNDIIARSELNEG